MTSAMAAGDGGAVEAFYRRYFDRLYAEARRATRRDESFCLDVVQESVLRIVRTVRAPAERDPARRVAAAGGPHDGVRPDAVRARRQRREALAAIGPADEAPGPSRGQGRGTARLAAHQLDRLDPEIADDRPALPPPLDARADRAAVRPVDRHGGRPAPARAPPASRPPRSCRTMRDPTPPPSPSPATAIDAGSRSCGSRTVGRPSGRRRQAHGARGSPSARDHHLSSACGSGM